MRASPFRGWTRAQEKFVVISGVWKVLPLRYTKKLIVESEGPETLRNCSAVFLARSQPKLAHDQGQEPCRTENGLHLLSFAASGEWRRTRPTTMTAGANHWDSLMICLF